jgi:glucose-1-phosphate cytidylyltransferase
MSINKSFRAQAIILAGGLGTRIAEETSTRPKPMLEIGGMPIIWHIMKIYASHGINDFIICCGYKGYMIKEYFANYLLHLSDVTIDIARDTIEIHNHKAEPWRITLVDTGESTQTGGRLKRVANYIKGDYFCMTYGDGLSSVNISDSIKFHQAHGKLATLTAVQPPGRFGALQLSGKSVEKFLEKPSGDGGWINGGYFVLSPQVLVTRRTKEGGRAYPRQHTHPVPVHRYGGTGMTFWRCYLVGLLMIVYWYAHEMKGVPHVQVPAVSVRSVCSV